MADDLQVYINVKSNADAAARGLDRLQGSIVNNLKIVQRLEKDYKILDRAFNTGKISAQKYAQGVQQVDAAIDQVLNGTQRLSSAVNQNAASMTKSAVATSNAALAAQKLAASQRLAGKTTNKFGMVTQQVGYQVGDFFVQVQSGTDALVAFGQQGTQLAGLLPGLKGAILGIGLAISTALGRAYLESKNLTINFKGVKKSFADALQPLKPTIDLISSAFSSLTSVVKGVGSLISTNIARLISYAAAFATILAVKVVAGFVLSGKAATAFFRLVKAGLISTGIGALVVILGEVLYRLNLMVTNAGSIAKAWEAVKKVFVSIYDYLIAQVDVYIAKFKTIGPAFKAFMLGMLNSVLQATSKAINSAIDGLNQMFDKFGLERISSVNLGGWAEESLTQAQIQLGEAERKVMDLQTAAEGAGAAIADSVREVLGLAKEAENSKALDTSNWFKTKESKEDLDKLKDKLEEIKDAADPFRAYNRELKELRGFLKKGLITQKEYNHAVGDLNEELSDTIAIVGQVEDAFADWMKRGFSDFKDFVSSIGNLFKNLLIDMAAAALRNRILIPIATGTAAGFGSTAAASAMGQYAAGGAQAGTIGATLATGMSNFGSAALHTITGGTAGSVAAGSTMASIGAVAPYILAAVAVIGLFTKKVKQLDSGLRVTIDSTGTLVEQFNKLQTSRLFGLIRRTSTSYAQAGADVADPIVDAIGNMQQSIIDAAGTLGIGAAAFDNFSYQFKVSLKGLTEEEQLQKINEEITKMGDSFASLSGHFSTMNELLAAAQQRYDIETRLLGLLNNQSALLTRQREAERAATNELNRGLLEQVYKLEDAYSVVNNAFAVVQRSIEARKTAITNSFNEIMETIQGRIEAAQAAVGVSGGIVSSLEGAAGGSGMTRGAGLAYLRSLRGASRITDQKKLDDALQAIADPSQDLYTNFVDYQRDFQDQTNLVRELEEKAKLQLSTDEQTLLQLQEEAKAAQARYDSQIEKLDEQLANAQAQLDALYGIDTSVKSVTEAISALGIAINGAMAAQSAAKAFQSAAGVGGTGAAATGKSFSEQYGTGSQYKGYDLAKLSGSGDLLAAAAMLGVGTTGKTGAQIQQAISNASGMAVRLDNATRSQQFAMGGMFGGGVRMVGERGPELEATGPSRIFSTKQTSELFRNPELVDEVRSLRSEVAGLRSENRQLQTSISKYSKRNYDINRKWDTDGLPATRT